MKKVSLSLLGKRYEVNLEDDFAEYVINDMESSGLSLQKDNNPSILLKAYLKQAHKNRSYEDEIELLIDTLEGF
jgi:hypothetical protein